MRVLICGDRHWTDREMIRSFIAGLPEGSVVIEGEAPGADSIARDEALALGFEVERYPADWKRYGRGGGPVRNTQMLEEGKPELVVAFHADLTKSRGTFDMLLKARNAGIPVEIYT